jgi:hypothetical protein
MAQEIVKQLSHHGQYSGLTNWSVLPAAAVQLLQSYK